MLVKMLGSINAQVDGYIVDVAKSHDKQKISADVSFSFVYGYCSINGDIQF